MQALQTLICESFCPADAGSTWQRVSAYLVFLATGGWHFFLFASLCSFLHVNSIRFEFSIFFKLLLEPTSAENWKTSYLRGGAARVLAVLLIAYFRLDLFWFLPIILIISEDRENSRNILLWFILDGYQISGLVQTGSH